MPCRKRIVFLPLLDYGDVIDKNATLTSLKALDAVYHSAIWFVTGSSYNTHHCTLYNLIGWPSLSERRSRHWLLYIYKAIMSELPPYISSLLLLQSHVHHTRSSNHLQLRVPNVRSELGKTAFSFDAPRTWNSAQQALGLSSLISYGQFKALISNLPSPVCNCFTWPFNLHFYLNCLLLINLLFLIVFYLFIYSLFYCMFYWYFMIFVSGLYLPFFVYLGYIGKEDCPQLYFRAWNKG